MVHARQVGITNNEGFTVARVISLRFPRLRVVCPLDLTPPHATGNRATCNCLGMHPLNRDSLSNSGSPNQVERLAEGTHAFIGPLKVGNVKTGCPCMRLCGANGVDGIRFGALSPGDNKRPGC